MRIAFFTPLPPIRSALSDYAEGMAMALANLPEVSLDFFVSADYQPETPLLKEGCQAFPVESFPALAQDYDIYLYSMGDHGRYHGYMLPYLHEYPGIVILNDLTLHRCILQSTVGLGQPEAYLQELKYALGIDDVAEANRIQNDLNPNNVLDYPLFERVVDSSLGVIVQNNYARQRILERRPNTKVTCIPYPFFMPPGFPEFDLATERARQRADLNLADDALVVGSFGIFVPDKHLGDCLQAFAYLVRQNPQAHYLLGGFAAEDYDLEGHIAALGLSDNVSITGWKPPLEFVRYMFALDVGIHLRHPHIGGTPYTPIRLMGLDVCTLVSDIEPLAEIPQGACIKLEPDAYQAQTLAYLLSELATDIDLRREISHNGREFIQQYHQVDAAARKMTAFMERIQTQ